MNESKSISDFARFVAFGPATLGEKTSLLPKRPSGVFGDHQITEVTAEEKRDSPTVNDGSLKISLTAAKLTGKADAIEMRVSLCKAEEAGKKDLLSKAQVAYCEAAKAKSMSGLPGNLNRTEIFEHMSVLYDSAGFLFEKSAEGNPESQETKDKIASAEEIKAKADKKKEEVIQGELSSLLIQDDDEEGEKGQKCVIS